MLLQSWNTYQPSIVIYKKQLNERITNYFSTTTEQDFPNSAKRPPVTIYCAEQKIA